MKKYRILISPSVNDRMYEHFLFLAQASENAAHDLLNRLIQDIKSLEYMPQRSPYLIRPYLEQRKYRYKLSYRRYRIVYQVVGTTVFVEDIHDCRQDDEKNLL